MDLSHVNSNPFDSHASLDEQRDRQKKSWIEAVIYHSTLRLIAHVTERRTSNLTFEKF